MDMKYLVERCRVTLESLYYKFANLINPPQDPLPTDLLTCYLKVKNKDFNPKDKTVLVGAFLLKQNNGNWEKSLFNITKMLEKSIWAMGRRWTVINPFPRKSGKNPIKARADLQTTEILKEDLSVKISPSPHPRHVNILNWPSEEPSQLLKATQLVSKSIYKIPNT
jgi:hypothetical protein